MNYVQYHVFYYNTSSDDVKINEAFVDNDFSLIVNYSNNYPSTTIHSLILSIKFGTLRFFDKIINLLSSNDYVTIGININQYVENIVVDAGTKWQDYDVSLVLSKKIVHSSQLLSLYGITYLYWIKDHEYISNPVWTNITPSDTPSVSQNNMVLDGNNPFIVVRNTGPINPNAVNTYELMNGSFLQFGSNTADTINGIGATTSTQVFRYMKENTTSTIALAGSGWETKITITDDINYVSMISNNNQIFLSYVKPDNKVYTAKIDVNGSIYTLTEILSLGTGVTYNNIWFNNNILYLAYYTASDNKVKLFTIDYTLNTSTQVGPDLSTGVTISGLVSGINNNIPYVGFIEQANFVMNMNSLVSNAWVSGKGNDQLPSNNGSCANAFMLTYNNKCILVLSNNDGFNYVKVYSIDTNTNKWVAVGNDNLVTQKHTYLNLAYDGNNDKLYYSGIYNNLVQLYRYPISIKRDINIIDKHYIEKKLVNKIGEIKDDNTEKKESNKRVQKQPKRNSKKRGD